MPADTAAKRYSAINIACPWRGLNVVPDVALPQGERQAVMYMYSGILAGALSVSALGDVIESFALARVSSRLVQARQIDREVLPRVLSRKVENV